MGFRNLSIYNWSEFILYFKSMGCMHYQTLVMYYDSTSEWVVVLAAYTSSAATTTAVM